MAKSLFFCSIQSFPGRLVPESGCFHCSPMVQNETARPNGRIYSSLCVPLTFYVQSKMRRGGAVPLKQRKSCTPVCVLSIPRMTQPPEKKPYLLKKEKKNPTEKVKQPPFGAIGRKRRHRTGRRVAARVTKMWDVFADWQGRTDPLITGARISAQQVLNDCTDRPRM